MNRRFVLTILKSRAIAIVLALAISATATSVVFAKSSAGSSNGQSASYTEYGCPPGKSGSKCVEKPGCGNEKNIGISGNSGAHGGQPPKAEERGDCPHDPGVDGN